MKKICAKCGKGFYKMVRGTLCGVCLSKSGKVNAVGNNNQKRARINYRESMRGIGIVINKKQSVGNLGNNQDASGTITRDVINDAINEFLNEGGKIIPGRTVIANLHMIQSENSLFSLFDEFDPGGAYEYSSNTKRSERSK